jgi:hypothetical protein
MIDPIRISVPTTVEITIKQAQLFPYRGVRPLRDDFNDTSSWIGPNLPAGSSGPSACPQLTPTRTNQGPRPAKRSARYLYDPIRAPVWWNNLLELEDAKEIDIPYGDWRGMLYNDKVKTELLADPQNKVGLFFIGSKNFRQIMDQPSGTEMFVIDDVFYRRITWRSLGKKDFSSETGEHVGWRTEHGLTFFLCPCKKLNQREYKTAILDGIGIEVMKRDEPVAAAASQG